MREFTDEEWQQIEKAVEALGDLIRQEADGRDDDELICIQSAFDAIADACHQPRPDLPNDGWVEAGWLRRQTRILMEAVAAGEIRD